jgi:hypothetical protein
MSNRNKFFRRGKKQILVQSALQDCGRIQIGRTNRATDGAVWAKSAYR